MNSDQNKTFAELHFPGLLEETQALGWDFDPTSSYKSRAKDGGIWISPSAVGANEVATYRWRITYYDAKAGMNYCPREAPCWMIADTLRILGFTQDDLESIDWTAEAIDHSFSTRYCRCDSDLLI